MPFSKARGDYKQNSEENYDPGLQKLCHRGSAAAVPAMSVELNQCAPAAMGLALAKGAPTRKQQGDFSN